VREVRQIEQLSAFKTHCIDDWTKTRQVCPIDELAWTHQQTADIIA